MPIATWTHGGSPLNTDIGTPPAGVAANGDLAASAATWNATGNENGDTGTVAITSEVSPGNIATVSVSVQLFDDGSFTGTDPLNTLQIIFDWALTNGPMGTATAASAFNSTMDATDDSHGPGSSTGTYDRTDTGTNLGIPTIADMFTAIGIGGIAAITVNCPFTYSAGTFSAHNRRLAISNLQIVANYGTSTVTDISPDIGPVAGGQVVTITGTGLTGVTEVNFINGLSTLPASGVTVAADGLSLTCVTPPAVFAAGSFIFGPYDVEVVGVGTLSGAYTYVGVVKVTPASGPITGGQAVTISGSGFNAATNVKFGANAVSAFTIVSDTEITTTTPFHRSGVVDVQVVGVATGADLYTYSANRGFPTGLPATAFKLPPVPVASPVAQGLATGQPIGSGGLTQTGGGTPMELSNQKWLMVVKSTLESIPFMTWGAEQIAGVFDPDQIPQLPFSRLDFDHSPRLLGRTSDGAGAAEEIQVGPTLTLADGLLSISGLPSGYTIGDLLYADSDHSLALLNDVSVGSYLRSGGVATAPLWSTLKLPNAANSGDILRASGANVYASVAPEALTRVNDTNVTLTLGGTPASALVNATSLTLGWTGTLAVTRGGTGTGTTFTQGSVVFAGVAGIYSQNNAKLFWDDTLIAMGVGTSTPTNRFHVIGDTAASVGTTPGTAAQGVVTVSGGTGGNTTIVTTGTGGAGADLTITGGQGGRATAAATASTGGRGGAPALTGGVGGAASVAGTGTNNGGTGGQVSLRGGTGGDATGATSGANTGGTGGALSFIAGVGGSATTGSGTLAGGTGGTAALIGGVGGTGSSGGSGGNAQLESGAAGSGTDRNAGIVILRAGAGTGSGTSTILFQTATTLASGSTAQTNSTKMTLLGSGNFGIGVGTPTATLHLKAGTTAASTAPLKFNTGSLLTTAEAGAVEFLTDDFYGTITTGAARKKFVLDDGTALTATRVPFATTNGRLTDDSDMTFATDTLTVTKLSAPTSVSTGTLAQTGKTTTYNNVATAGWGEPAIYGSGRSTAQTAAVASVAAYTNGAADGSFVIVANVLVTTSTTHNFTVAVDYTDEGSTARTLTLSFTLVAGGALVTAVDNANGAVPYMGVPQRIRSKASTAITIKTVGTFTTVTYNVEGSIIQVA